jgi:hypothetical protein
MTEADCLALIARGADRIAQWRRANAQARRKAEEQAAAEAERAANHAYFDQVAAAKQPGAAVLAFTRGDRNG